MWGISPKCYINQGGNSTHTLMAARPIDVCGNGAFAVLMGTIGCLLANDMKYYANVQYISWGVTSRTIFFVNNLDLYSDLYGNGRCCLCSEKHERKRCMCWQWPLQVSIIILLLVLKFCTETEKVRLTLETNLHSPINHDFRLGDVFLTS